MTLSPRERLLKAINHEEPDCVPIDMGGTDITTLMAGPYKRLCEYLGIDPEPIYLVDPYLQCVLIKDEVAKRMGCNINAQVIYFLPKSWYQGEAYDGTPVLLPDTFRPQTLPDGSRVILDQTSRFLLAVDIRFPRKRSSAAMQVTRW